MYVTPCSQLSMCSLLKTPSPIIHAPHPRESTQEALSSQPPLPCGQKNDKGSKAEQSQNQPIPISPHGTSDQGTFIPGGIPCLSMFGFLSPQWKFERKEKQRQYSLYRGWILDLHFSCFCFRFFLCVFRVESELGSPIVLS